MVKKDGYSLKKGPGKPLTREKASDTLNTDRKLSLFAFKKGICYEKH
jgi:hypothetical protein